MADGTNTCPVSLIQRYMDRCGFLLGDKSDRNFLIPTARVINYRVGQIMVADGSRPVQDGTALSDLRKLCLSVGYTRPVSTKSPKISGVSDSFRAGLSATQVADKGRWKTEAAVHYYRRNHDGYARQIAQSNTIACDGARPGHQRIAPMVPVGAFHDQFNYQEDEIYQEARRQQDRVHTQQDLVRWRQGGVRVREMQGEGAARLPRNMERLGIQDRVFRQPLAQDLCPVRPRILGQFCRGVAGWTVQSGTEAAQHAVSHLE